MGLADRDDMRARRGPDSEVVSRAGPSEPSAATTLVHLLLFALVAWGAYKAWQWRHPSPVNVVDPASQKKAKCQAYEEEIKQIDARARQPLSGSEQERLAAKRKTARDEQFRLRC